MRLTLAFILALPLAAAPTEIPITGTAWLSGYASAYFSLSGPNFSLYSETFDFISGCPYAPFEQPCYIPITIPSDYNFCGFCYEGSYGTFNGVVAEKISGFLTFTPTPGTTDISVSGDVQGNSVGRNAGGLYLIPLWNLTISGSGTGAEFWSSGPAANYSFTGTATELPEPSSFWLLGIGLTALLLP